MPDILPLDLRFPSLDNSLLLFVTEVLEFIGTLLKLVYYSYSNQSLTAKVLILFDTLAMSRSLICLFWLPL